MASRLPKPPTWHRKHETGRVFLFLFFSHLLAQPQLFLSTLTPGGTTATPGSACSPSRNTRTLQMPVYGLIIETLAERHWFKWQIRVISFHFGDSKAFRKCHQRTQKPIWQWSRRRISGRKRTQGEGASAPVSLERQASRQGTHLSLQRWRSGQVEAWGKDTVAKRARLRCRVSQPVSWATSAHAQIYRKAGRSQPQEQGD